MKNILKTLAIALVLLLSSCSKEELGTKQPESSYSDNMFILIEVKSSTGVQYEMLPLNGGSYCGEVTKVSNSTQIDQYGDEFILYDVSVKSYRVNVINGINRKKTIIIYIKYKKTDIQPNYKIGSDFCIDMDF